jgi:hypothetical protein
MQRLCTEGPAHAVPDAARAWKAVVTDTDNYKYNLCLKTWTCLCVQNRLGDVLHELWACIAKDGNPTTRMEFLKNAWVAASEFPTLDPCRHILQQQVADMARAAHDGVISSIGRDLVEPHGMAKIEEWITALPECLMSPRCVLAMVLRVCWLRNEELLQWLCLQPQWKLQACRDPGLLKRKFWSCVRELLASGPLVRGDQVFWDTHYFRCLDNGFPDADLKCLLQVDADPVGRRCWQLLAGAMKPSMTAEPCTGFIRAYATAVNNDNATMVELMYLLAEACGQVHLVKWPIPIMRFPRRHRKRGLIRKYSKNSMVVLDALSKPIRYVWIACVMRGTVQFCSSKS